MKSTKETTFAFIVRIWVEHGERKDAEPIWRGVIEPVEGDERVYFDRLERLSTYLARYLEAVGIKAHHG